MTDRRNSMGESLRNLSEAHRAQPFCPALHEQMLARGAKYDRIEEYWEDTGDPENGPGGLSGWPATDQYVDVDYVFYSTETGRLDAEKRDLELEAIEDEMIRAYGSAEADE